MKKDERTKKIEQNFEFVINYESLLGNYSSRPHTQQNLSDIQHQNSSISSIPANNEIREVPFSLDSSFDDEEEDEEGDEEDDEEDHEKDDEEA